MIKVKRSIQDFVRYKPSEVPYDIKLDANESIVNETLLRNQLSIDDLNRYPDHYMVKLRKKIADRYGIDMEEVMVGSGSSELLELVTKTYIDTNDIVLSIEPSFVMYKKYTKISGGVYQSYPTNENFELDIDGFIKEAKRIQPKLIFLCTPNNPTGAIINRNDVIRIIEEVDSLIVVDEAYMEFSQSDESVVSYINQYPNLIVNRTFSKAYGLAGARLGYFITNKELIETLYTTKTPYSVSTLSQQLGVMALSDDTYLNNNVEMIWNNRVTLEKRLEKLNIKTYPSSTNFIFCEYKEKDLQKELEKKRILIRGFGQGLYRITVGTKEENDALIKALEEII